MHTFLYSGCSDSATIIVIDRSLWMFHFWRLDERKKHFSGNSDLSGGVRVCVCVCSHQWIEHDFTSGFHRKSDFSAANFVWMWPYSRACVHVWVQYHWWNCLRSVLSIYTYFKYNCYHGNISIGISILDLLLICVLSQASFSQIISVVGKKTKSSYSTQCKYKKWYESSAGRRISCLGSIRKNILHQSAFCVSVSPCMYVCVLCIMYIYQDFVWLTATKREN